jgi:nucleoside-diphosphate-sugar epimerase
VAQGELADTTHLVYTALFEKPGLIAGWREQDQMQTNLTMLRNLIEPLVETPNQLRNITLLQGTKAYAAHIKPMRIPGREREPRVEHENFYWLQEDYLKARQHGQRWSTTIWRPQIIFGHALGAPMNMLAALGVYAAICQHRNEPFSYPGGPSGVMEAIDADLLAAAILHSFDNPDFANETFNITNGDVYRWHDLWPAIARAVGLPPGEPQPTLLSQTCYNEDEWQQIVTRHGLRPHSVRDLVGDSFFYADALFNLGGDSTPPPAIVSTIKLRQAGFHHCIDTEDMLMKWFSRLRQMRLLP